MHGGLDGKSVWRGRDEYVEFLQTWTAEFRDWSVRVERLIDAGPDRVVALTHQTGTGRASVAPVELNLRLTLDERVDPTQRASSRLPLLCRNGHYPCARGACLEAQGQGLASRRWGLLLYDVEKVGRLEHVYVQRGDLLERRVEGLHPER